MRMFGVLRAKTDKESSKGFSVWKNSKGEWCIGNKCFTMRATDEGVRVKMSPNSKGCPANLKEAAEQLMKAVQAGKPTQYVKLRDEDEF